MNKIELFGQGLIAGFFAAIWILYLSGYFNVDKDDIKQYRQAPDGLCVTVIQNCMIAIVAILCGIAAVLVFN